MNDIKKFDLEERLIDFAVSIITIAENLKINKSANHLAGQILRSGSSPALNYGEAQSAESRGDFIHKFRIILKELRETLIALKIIKKANLYKELSSIENASRECAELIAIFAKSVKTTKMNGE